MCVGCGGLYAVWHSSFETVGLACLTKWQRTNASGSFTSFLTKPSSLSLPQLHHSSLKTNASGSFTSFLTKPSSNVCARCAIKREIQWYDASNFFCVACLWSRLQNLSVFAVFDFVHFILRLVMMMFVYIHASSRTWILGKCKQLSECEHLFPLNYTTTVCKFFCFVVCSFQCS